MLAQQAHIQTTGRQEWKQCIGSTTWTSCHQDGPGYCYCWVPNLPWTEANTEPQCGSSRRGAWLAGQQQVDDTETLWSWRGQHCALTGRDAYSRYGSAIPAPCTCQLYHPWSCSLQSDSQMQHLLGSGIPPSPPSLFLLSQKVRKQVYCHPWMMPHSWQSVTPLQINYHWVIPIWACRRWGTNRVPFEKLRCPVSP